MADPDAPDPYRLDRFVSAQDTADTYARALAELQRGRKSGHWMWFVFPQLAGLGQSPTSRHFAISGLAEARAYLEHPVLGPRLRESAAVLIGLRDRSAIEIFGAVDAQKLRSSMTLFQRAEPAAELWPAVLQRYYGGESDPLTEDLLAE